MLRRTFLALVLLAPLSSLAAQDASLTVFVVRHAEKGPESPDPSLTGAGQRRATALARVLKDAHVTALFATEFKRTQEPSHRWPGPPDSSRCWCRPARWMT